MRNALSIVKATKATLDRVWNRELSLHPFGSGVLRIREERHGRSTGKK
jgi:hypothetical protein